MNLVNRHPTVADTPEVADAPSSTAPFLALVGRAGTTGSTPSAAAPGGYAHETGSGPFGDRSIVAFAVRAEL